MINRRRLLAAAALVGGSIVLGSPSASRPNRGVDYRRADYRRADYRGPNVVIVRFGGGVRRRETIDPDHTHSPYLLKTLAPRGTLFSNMEIADLSDTTQTSHAQGTLYLLTGRYDRYRDIDGRSFSERFEPAAPTLFEYLRKSYAVPAHECLIINGEDRKTEEYLTFSNHDLYGVDFRCHTLSLARYKRYLLEKQIDEGIATGATRRALAEPNRLDYRNAERLGESPELELFWSKWRDHYGDTGLVNARGDALLTDLALEALHRLRPKLMLINYQDPDYVHWGNPSHYTRGIAVIDRGLRTLVAAIDSDPVYRDNTLIVVVPDCGRDDNRYLRVPYQHHFNSPSAHEIWALLIGPGVPRGRDRRERVGQIDVPATVGALMGLPTPEVEGKVLL